MQKNENIFLSKTERIDFINTIYDELMTREPVTYRRVLEIEGCVLPNTNCKQSYVDCYEMLKKAFGVVKKRLEEIEPGCIEKATAKDHTCTFRYVGKDDDPLREERNVTIQKSLEDYVTFCMNASGMFPRGWFDNYFQNTQLLAEAHRSYKKGSYHISYGHDHNLRNIQLLPQLNDAIMQHKVLRFAYKPYEGEAYNTTFHPQFLKEYNGRWFLFGESDHYPFQAVNIAIDRIEGDIAEVTDVPYIVAPDGFYHDYFRDIIGVTHLKKQTRQTIRIRTLDCERHNFIATKTFHDSMNETKPFDSEKEYGEFTLEVEVNRELITKLLSYGADIEVVEPETLRKEMAEVVRKMRDIYLK